MKKERTKAELVALLADYPDDAPVEIYIPDTSYRSEFIDAFMLDGKITITA